MAITYLARLYFSSVQRLRFDSIDAAFQQPDLIAFDIRRKSRVLASADDANLTSPVVLDASSTEAKHDPLPDKQPFFCRQKMLPPGRGWSPPHFFAGT